MLGLLHSLPKAAVVALGSLALAGGAVGAAASAGGTEVPRPIESVLSVLGFGGAEQSSDDSATATPSAGSGSRGRAKGTATSTSTPVASSIPGLCRAFMSGSDRGREHKSEGVAFLRLKNAATGAGQTIEAYCETVLIGKRPTPTATGTATSGSSPRGKSQDARGQSDSKSHGKPEDRGPAYSPAGGGRALGAPQSDDSHGKGKPDAAPVTSQAANASSGPGNSSGSTTPGNGNGGGSANAGGANPNAGGGNANAGGGGNASSGGTGNGGGGGNGGGSDNGGGRR